MKATITIKKNDTNEYEILVNGESYEGAPVCSSEQEAAETIFVLWGSGMNAFELEEVSNGVWEIEVSENL